MDGVYRCCAKGEGRDCCDGYDLKMCYSFGGIYGDCMPEGEVLEARIICSKCCVGLTEAIPYSRNDSGVCDYYEGLTSLRVCIRCGDGACGKDENPCNCSADCPN